MMVGGVIPNFKTDGTKNSRREIVCIYMFQNVMKTSISNFGKFDATREHRRAKLENRENMAVLKFYDYRLQ